MDEKQVGNLVSAIIKQAFLERASDIHLEPQPDGILIRFRTDGLLREVQTLPETVKGLVTSRIKIIGNMDIAEKRTPQDGRTSITIDQNEKKIELDLRISTLPVMHGEKVVIRLLLKDKNYMKLEELGFSPEGLEIYKGFLEKAQGLVLITGPTGSGKTSTLYSSLLRVKNPSLNIVTIEDPIEYQLPDINQVQVHPKAGLTFAGGLRSILRQDPDIIMVGEIRDKETASIVFQSALTGHLVFSTLHTNDTVSSITRLMDMGVEPFLIASAVLGIIAQRLIRVICPECKTPYIPEPDAYELLELENDKNIPLYRGTGCFSCRGKGYWGREAIFEILPLTEDFKNLIHTRVSEKDLKEMALKEGVQTLKKEGIKKVLEGRTTIEELLRVVML